MIKGFLGIGLIILFLGNLEFWGVLGVLGNLGVFDGVLVVGEVRVIMCLRGFLD